MKRKAHMDVAAHVLGHIVTPPPTGPGLFGPIADRIDCYLGTRTVVSQYQEAMAYVDASGHTAAKEASSKPINSFLTGLFRHTATELRHGLFADWYRTRCLGTTDERTAILKRVSKQADDEGAEVDCAWADLTSVYPDTFDGDNIGTEKNHSCKWVLPLPTKPDGAVDPAALEWRIGAVCATINAQFWYISGRYKEMCKEPDVRACHDAREDVVEALVRLSQYILDVSTPVHLFKTSNEIHGKFEDALDRALGSALSAFVPVTKSEAAFEGQQHVKDRDIISAYDASDNIARLTAAKFATRFTAIYPDWSGIPPSLTAAKKQELASLCEDVVRDAAQNLADMYGFLWRKIT